MTVLFITWKGANNGYEEIHILFNKIESQTAVIFDVETCQNIAVENNLKFL